jgi:hypothetical protein
METNVIFPVSLLYIQLDVNIGGNEKKEQNIQLFKRSMIKMPLMNTPPIVSSEYPFFTKNVRYPASIENADWKVKYQFFFNRKLFVDRLRKEIDDNPNIYRAKLTAKKDASAEENDELYAWMIETEKHNIMVTLRALFPIPEYFGKALKDTYLTILTNKPNRRILSDINIRSAVNVFGFMYKFGIVSKAKEEYFIEIGDKKYTVNDVIWKNDIINHPVYSRFLASQRETYEEVNNSAGEVETKYNAYVNKLNDELAHLKKLEEAQKDFYLTRKSQQDCDADCKEKMFKHLKHIDKTTFNVDNSSKVDYNYLKNPTLFMMQQQMLLKIKSSNKQRYNTIIDRTNMTNTVARKINMLVNETGEAAADIILSMRDDFDIHRELHSGEGINIFMERDDELLFDRLVKMSIDIRAASIVLRFAKENVPMILTDKKPDGSEISQINKRVNKQINDFFATEANINNRLSSNVNDVFEPVRKTSNRDLYKVLKLFKFGDAVIRREYPNIDTEKERKVLENAYDKFVNNKKMDTLSFETYLYTGVDEVKAVDDTQKSNIGARNAYEVYVGMDLVNTDFYENDGKSNCKLTDKEMEQELLYLTDPQIKTQNVLTRYRDFSFEHEQPPPKKTGTIETKTGTTRKNGDNQKKVTTKKKR